jgi:hypothetical protein
VYAEPVDVWAARLTGPASVLTAKVVDARADRASLEMDGTIVEVDSTGAAPVGDAVPLLVRPGWARLGGELGGRLLAVRFRGPHSDHIVETAAGNLLIREPGPPRHAAGTKVTWALARTWPLDRPEVEVQPETTQRSLTELPT